MNLLSLFKRGPSIQQQHVDLWVKDRKAALRVYRQRREEFGFDAILSEFRPMLEAEQFCQSLEEASEKERIENNRNSSLTSSRFTVLRQKRGLPFKSRRQPV